MRTALTDTARWRDVARYDLPASVVVFLVALPLSLGIAMASGAPLMAGLIAGVVGGVVAGFVGGSPLQVSGPAAGLTVVVAELIAKFGWKVTAAITVAAGLVQILLGLSRVARAALAVSPIVVHAMLAGIGITIALQQTHVLLGGSSQSSVIDNLVTLPDRILHPRPAELAIGAIVIAIMIAWQRVPSTWKKVPGALVAVVTATAVSLIIPMAVKRITLDGSIIDAIGLPDLPHGNWSAVLLGVLTIALIASVESLLSAVAVDKMHDGARANMDRELIGQGAANTVSGLLGGLPVTGVIVRSATNVAAGARTRWSAVLHGLWLLLFSVAFVGVVQQIPTSALAGLLIVIGVQLVKLAHIKTAHRTGELTVYAVTLAGVLLLNLLQGVLIGLAVAVALVLWRVVKVAIHAEPDASGAWHVTIDGSLSFIALPRLSGALARVPEGADVTVELTADYLDHAASTAIEEWARRHRTTGGAVTIDDLGTAALTDAAAGVPVRSSSRWAQRGMLPWRAHAHHGLFSGIDRYHRRHAEILREDYADLRQGQRPQALFLTCADSRVVPNVITGSGPGDLFTVRNVGNLIPADRSDTSIEAAVEFALDELGVHQVVVCGHSGCGAMSAALAGAPGAGPVQRWIAQTRPSLAAFHGKDPIRAAARAAGFTDVDQLAVVNVAQQLRVLHEHPTLLRAAAVTDIELIGLFFDIATGTVWTVTESTLTPSEGALQKMSSTV